MENNDKVKISEVVGVLLFALFISAVLMVW